MTNTSRALFEADPLLRAGEHQLVAIVLGQGCDVPGVAADVGLGEQENRDLLPSGNGGQPAFALLVRAPPPDGIGHHVLDGHEVAHVLAGATEFLGHHRVAQRTDVRAASPGRQQRREPPPTGRGHESACGARCSTSIDIAVGAITRSA
jgi:hypothetical protein